MKELPRAGSLSVDPNVLMTMHSFLDLGPMLLIFWMSREVSRALPLAPQLPPSDEVTDAPGSKVKGTSKEPGLPRTELPKPQVS